MWWANKTEDYSKHRNEHRTQLESEEQVEPRGGRKLVQSFTRNSRMPVYEFETCSEKSEPVKFFSQS